MIDRHSYVFPESWSRILGGVNGGGYTNLFIRSGRSDVDFLPPDEPLLQQYVWNRPASRSVTPLLSPLNRHCPDNTFCNRRRVR